MNFIVLGEILFLIFIIYLIYSTGGLSWIIWLIFSIIAIYINLTVPNNGNMPEGLMATIMYFFIASFIQIIYSAISYYNTSKNTKIKNNNSRNA